MFEIRQLRSSEYEFLWDMLYEAIYVPDDEQKLPKSIVREPSLSKYAADFGRDRDIAFLLKVDDELAGLVWARLFSKNDAGYGFVDEETPEISIALYAQFRNRGYGSLLLEKMIQALKDSGAKKVSLSVNQKNPAVNLYKRTGFKIVNTSGTSLIMLKKL